MRIAQAERFFNLGCSTVGFFGRYRLVHDTRLGLGLARHFYSWVCSTFTGAKQPIQHSENIYLPGPGQTLALRIYRARTDRALPAIIFMHGGCFCVGDLDSHDALARALANVAQCAVVSVDYRRSPTHPFPAGADDAYRALAWVAANAEILGIDRDRIALAGDSAGGAIAAVVARWARDRGGPKVALQLLLYPMIDAAMQTRSWQKFAEGPIINRSILKTAWARYAPDVDQRHSADVSPLAASDLRGLPPTIVVTADNDPLKDEGQEYARALDLAQVPVSLLHYENTVHGFLQVPDSRNSRAALTDIAAELAKLFEFAVVGKTHDAQFAGTRSD